MQNVPFLSLQAATEELRREIDEAISRVVGSGHYIGGPEVESFEAEFAGFVGARHCIGVGNGLDALTLALLAHGVGPGDEVLVPSNTFIATWLGATHARATPIPVQPDFETHVVTPEGMAAAITPRTRALLPVHLYGLPVDMPGFRQLASERGLTLVDDAAQAHGASVAGTPIGGFGNTTTWSFYPGKNLGALGDAGAVTTDDDGIASQLRRMRNYGSSTKYVHECLGFNSRLDPIQAAVLRVKLRHLAAWNDRRRNLASLYLEGLRGIGDLRLPTEPIGRKHVFHLFVVRTSRRDALRGFLEREGIGTLTHYPRPAHLQEAYAEAKIDHNALVETTKNSEEVVSLPMGPHLTANAVAQVIQTIVRFFRA